ncbi:early nodulin-93-like [Solanum pennellii]|uniref:Early nodulin-93-like n=1 Tax=Solanum pennellii TaxID=28526 RepID=A0ABM1FS11_SOLPN|nr:early nodulin-93-like [Solanum pennellii]
MAKNVSLDSIDQKLAYARRCSHEGAKAGAKAAVFATVVTAIPTYACGKISPWARAHLNPTAKALIVSTAAGMAYFIVADQTILKRARQNSFKQQG